MKQQLRALFFDFDGVIVDSVKIKAEAFRLLFQDYPDDVIQKVLAYHKQHGGISRVEKIVHAHAHFIGVPITGKEIEKWALRYSDLVVEKVVEVDWITGAREFLEASHESKLDLFVISGTPEAELKYILDRRGIAGFFHECLGSPIRKPVHIRKLLHKYNLQPSECVFIGDAFTDYDAAKETGLHFIGIQGEVEFPPGTIVLSDCRGLQEALDDMFTCKPQSSNHLFHPEK